LAQYVADVRPNQTEIYYLVGDSVERLKSNPKLEAARARGIEVLLLTDPVDALWTAMPLGFDGKPLKSLSQGEVDFGLVPLVETDDKTDAAAEGQDIAAAAVIAAAKAALADLVSEVRASQRLTDSPACLVAESRGPDRELARLLARQESVGATKPILELNMRHALVKALGRAAHASHDEEVADLAVLLFEQAQILDGELPADPAAFTARLNRLVVRGLPAG
jgi:molecular chaperone HtpG